jgi:hypothetical protein
MHEVIQGPVTLANQRLSDIMQLAGYGIFLDTGPLSAKCDLLHNEIDHPPCKIGERLDDILAVVFGQVESELCRPPKLFIENPLAILMERSERVATRQSPCGGGLPHYSVEGGISRFRRIVRSLIEATS